MSMFVRCTCGSAHYGSYGAAGLLLLSEGCALLQERSRYVDNPGTWSIPGGALRAGETPREAAIRETGEELAGLDTSALAYLAEHRDDHGPWTYTTVIATVPDRPHISAGNFEAARVTWVALEDVPWLHLHPGMAATWPALAALTTKEHA